MTDPLPYEELVKEKDMLIERRRKLVNEVLATENRLRFIYQRMAKHQDNLQPKNLSECKKRVSDLSIEIPPYKKDD